MAREAGSFKFLILYRHSRYEPPMRLQFTFFGLLAVNAHICFVYPTQRGAYNVTTPGDPSCYRRVDYCGGVAPGTPLTKFVAGEVITITLDQK